MELLLIGRDIKMNTSEIKKKLIEKYGNKDFKRVNKFKLNSGANVREFNYICTKVNDVLRILTIEQNNQLSIYDQKDNPYDFFKNMNEKFNPKGNMIDSFVETIIEFKEDLETAILLEVIERGLPLSKEIIKDLSKLYIKDFEVESSEDEFEIIPNDICETLEDISFRMIFEKSKDSDKYYIEYISD